MRFFQRIKENAIYKQLIVKNYFMQINKSFFFLSGDLFMYFIFNL